MLTQTMFFCTNFSENRLHKHYLNPTSPKILAHISNTQCFNMCLVVRIYACMYMMVYACVYIDSVHKSYTRYMYICFTLIHCSSLRALTSADGGTYACVYTVHRKILESGKYAIYTIPKIFLANIYKNGGIIDRLPADSPKFSSPITSAVMIH